MFSCTSGEQYHEISHSLNWLIFNLKANVNVSAAGSPHKIHQAFKAKPSSYSIHQPPDRRPISTIRREEAECLTAHKPHRQAFRLCPR